MITAEMALQLAEGSNSLDGILEQINCLITQTAKGGYTSTCYSNKNFASDPELKKKVIAQLETNGYIIKVTGSDLYLYWRGV